MKYINCLSKKEIKEHKSFNGKNSIDVCYMNYYSNYFETVSLLILLDALLFVLGLNFFALGLTFSYFIYFIYTLSFKYICCKKYEKEEFKTELTEKLKIQKLKMHIPQKR